MEVEGAAIEMMVDGARNGRADGTGPAAALFGLPTVTEDSEDEAADWFRKGGDVDMWEAYD